MPASHSSAISKRSTQRSTKAACLYLAIGLTVAMMFAPMATAQNYKVLYSFTGGEDGADPEAGLTMDVAGNLYGTAAVGGYHGGSCSDYGGCGTVFKLSPGASGWHLTPLYHFTDSPDGKWPTTRVVFGPDGSLYGTTVNGGLPGCGYGCGTVFNLRPPATACKVAPCGWNETPIYRFKGKIDGNPTGEPVFDHAGNIYGNAGSVFELVRSNEGWIEKILYIFEGLHDGYGPAALTIDDSGNLYSTCGHGGAYGFGTAFQLTPSGSGWQENILHNFEGGADGEYPIAGLTLDPAGNLYGGTQSGSVFELRSSNGNWIFGAVYTLDGEEVSANLTRDTAGNFYGVSWFGGAYNQGAVYKLTNSGGTWTYTSLHDFTGGSDGAQPTGIVILDGSGNLYGTAAAGGLTDCGSLWCGVVWEITP